MPAGDEGVILRRAHIGISPGGIGRVGERKKGIGEGVGGTGDRIGAVGILIWR